MGLDLGLTNILDIQWSTPGIINFSSGNIAILGASAYKSHPGPDEAEWIWEELELTLSGGIAAIRASQQTIQRSIELAREFYAVNSINQIGIYGRRDVTESYVISPIRNGYLSDPNYDELASGRVTVTFHFERRNYWMYASSTPTLTRDGGALPTPNISDCSDGLNTGYGARRNYFDINNTITDIPGDLPAYLAFGISPMLPDASYANMGRLYMFLATQDGDSSWSNLFPHHNEGNGTQTAGANTSYSGANFVSRTLNGSYTEIQVGDQANVWSGVMIGRRFALMAALPTIPAVALTYYLQHSLGAFQSSPKTGILPSKMSLLDVYESAPPPGFGEYMTAPKLFVKTADGSSQSLVSDFFQILPMDGYLIADVNTPLTEQTTLINYNRTAFSGKSVVALSPTVYKERVCGIEGPGLMPRPGKKNRIYFLWEREDHTYSPNDYFQIYTPLLFARRRML